VPDDLGGLWSVSHEIAEDPQFVIRLVEGIERFGIAVHVRDDQNLHRLAPRRDARRLVLRYQRTSRSAMEFASTARFLPG
jgi:hypothetical protein